MTPTTELALCMQVPQLVQEKLQPAAVVQAGLAKIAKESGETGRVMAWWNPDTKEVQLSLGRDVGKSRYRDWSKGIDKLAKTAPHLIGGVSFHYPTPEDPDASIWLLKDHNQMEDIYKAAAERLYPDADGPGGPVGELLEEFIKCGAAAEALQSAYLFDVAYAPLRGHEKRAANAFGKPYEWAGKPFGGPTPFSNAIVTSMLGWGLGNAAGWAASKILPDKYIDTDRLWRLMAVSGLAAGPVIHGLQAYGNTALNRKATGKPHYFRSIFAPGHGQEMPKDYYNRKALDTNNPNYLDQNAMRGMGRPKVGGAGLTGMQAIPVDAFNRMIWNDVHKGIQSNRYSPYGQTAGAQIHTPPPAAAVASSVVSGVSNMYGGTSLLSPRHLMTGLAAAGVDGATAKVTGGILGALGVLRPEAQSKLQDVGVWGGLMRGVAGSMMGMR